MAISGATDAATKGFVDGTAGGNRLEGKLQTSTHCIGFQTRLFNQTEYNRIGVVNSESKTIKSIRSFYKIIIYPYFWHFITGDVALFIHF